MGMVENIKLLLAVQDALRSADLYVNTATATVVAKALKESGMVIATRCKDCEFYNENDKRCDHPCLEWEVECYDLWLGVEPDDFCSYGERKENGD